MSRPGIYTVGASSIITKEGTLPGWFISFVATVIIRLHNGAKVCTRVGYVPTVTIAGEEGLFRSREKSFPPKIYISSGVFICAIADCKVPTTPLTCPSAPLSIALKILIVICAVCGFFCKSRRRSSSLLDTKTHT